MIVAEAGASARWSRAPAVTVSDAVAVTPPLLAVTVCTPALVAVHTLAAQEPSGASVNVLEPVTLPMSLLAASYPSAVKDCEPPAVTVAPAGLTTIWSSAGA